MKFDGVDFLGDTGLFGVGVWVGYPALGPNERAVVMQRRELLARRQDSDLLAFGG
jgi:hypothetical protein